MYMHENVFVYMYVYMRVYVSVDIIYFILGLYEFSIIINPASRLQHANKEYYYYYRKSYI